MRQSVAYFAGAGTVVVALAAGLGGGLVIANIVSPHTRELGKVELQAKAKSSEAHAAQQTASSEQPQPSPRQAQPTLVDAQPNEPAASNAAPAPVPYLAQIERAVSAPVVVSPAPQDSPPAQPQQGQTEQKVQASLSPQQQGESFKETVRADSQSAAGGDRDQPPRPENAYARAREADLKQLGDKRRAEQRRQQWAERHQHDREQAPRDAGRGGREDADTRNSDTRDISPRESDLRASNDGGPREVIVRRDDFDRPDSDRRDFDRRDFDHSDSDHPMRFEFPHFNLFGPD